MNRWRGRNLSVANIAKGWMNSGNQRKKLHLMVDVASNHTWVDQNFPNKKICISLLCGGGNSIVNFHILFPQAEVNLTEGDGWVVDKLFVNAHSKGVGSFPNGYTMSAPLPHLWTDSYLVYQGHMTKLQSQSTVVAKPHQSKSQPSTIQPRPTILWN